MMVIHLGDMSPCPSCGLPEGEHSVEPPIGPLYLALLRMGVTKPLGYPNAGELLPHLSTLALFKRAVSVSMALSEDRSSRMLSGILSMESGLSSGFWTINPATIRSAPNHFNRAYYFSTIHVHNSVSIMCYSFIMGYYDQ